jgi:hypothetical protein
MARVVRLSEDVRHPETVNLHQCLALAYYICGQIYAAKAQLEIARTMAAHMTGFAFSCWRYLEVSRNDMREDLNLLKEYIDGEGNSPTIFATDTKNLGGELLLN